MISKPKQEIYRSDTLFCTVFKHLKSCFGWSTLKTLYAMLSISKYLGEICSPKVLASYGWEEPGEPTLFMFKQLPKQFVLFSEPSLLILL